MIAGPALLVRAEPDGRLHRRPACSIRTGSASTRPRLFVTQILATKFIPPLNEVAFAAYARMQDRPDAIAPAFLKTVRLISLVAMPFYFGIAVTAEPLVAAVLGWRWLEAAALVPILAMAMPFMTLQILFGAGDQRDRPAGAAAAHRRARRGDHDRRLLRRHPLGRDRPRLGLAWRHGVAARRDAC